MRWVVRPAGELQRGEYTAMQPRGNSWWRRRHRARQARHTLPEDPSTLIADNWHVIGAVRKGFSQIVANGSHFVSIPSFLFVCSLSFLLVFKVLPVFQLEVRLQLSWKMRLLASRCLVCPAHLRDSVKPRDLAAVLSHGTRRPGRVRVIDVWQLWRLCSCRCWNRSRAKFWRTRQNCYAAHSFPDLFGAFTVSSSRPLRCARTALSRWLALWWHLCYRPTDRTIRREELADAFLQMLNAGVS